MILIVGRGDFYGRWFEQREDSRELDVPRVEVKEPASRSGARRPEFVGITATGVVAFQAASSVKLALTASNVEVVVIKSWIDDFVAVLCEVGRFDATGDRMPAVEKEKFHVVT